MLLKRLTKDNDAKVNERLTLVENTSSLENAIIKINTLLPKFKTHCFVKKQQSLHFENLKKDLTDKDLVAQFDFAENYSIVHQDEIQSAHWQHSQVAIFTCVIWGKNTTDSYAVVSDDLTHSKYSVWTFIKCILDHHNLSGIEEIHIFTDNCAAQFKSRFVISNLCFLEDDLGLTVTWNHFAASHGKGAVDGVGGVIKGKVWIATKSRQVLVNSAKDFYECAVSKCDKINVLYTPKEDVEANKPLLDARFSRALEITGIQSYHTFWRADESHIFARQTAISKETKIKVLQPLAKQRLRYNDVYSSETSDDEWPMEEEIVSCDSNNIEVGDWVVVIYDGWFPGVVERRDDNFLSVNFMGRSGANFLWPTRPDIQTIEPKDVLMKIETPPFPISRRHFGLNSQTIRQIETLYNKIK